MPRVSGIELRARPDVRGAHGGRVPEVQGHRQGREEESGVTRTVCPPAPIASPQTAVIGVREHGVSLPLARDASLEWTTPAA